MGMQPILALLSFRTARGGWGRRLADCSAALLISSAMVSGCAGNKLAPSGAGLAGGDAIAVSAVVAQARAQFPKLSATGVKHISREAPANAQRQSPNLVLKGAGAGVAPGIQVSAGPHIELELYLSKPGYDTGFALLSFEGRQKERWRIVAHDHRGRADADFEFIYLLASPQGELWYLAAIGGNFEQGGEKFRGMEATLIVPGKDGKISTWKRAFKIDFGMHFPLVPAYMKMVDAAVDKFRKLRRRPANLEARRRRIARSKAKLEGLLKAPDRGQGAGGSGKKGAAEKEQAHLDELEAEQARQAAEAGRELVSYYQLRETIAGEYADFVRGNPYSWVLPAHQQRYFDAWREVELQHPEIDEITGQVAEYMKNPTAVIKARAAAMAAVSRHGNGGKDPSRAIAPVN